MNISGTVKEKVTHFTGVEKYRIVLLASQGCSVLCMIKGKQTLALMQIPSYLPSSIHVIGNTILFTVFYGDLYKEISYIPQEKKEKQPKPKKHLPVSKLIVKTILNFNTLIKNTHGFFFSELHHNLSPQ